MAVCMSVIPICTDVLHDVVLVVMLDCTLVSCDVIVADKPVKPVPILVMEVFAASMLACNACTAVLAASMADVSTWTVICCGCAAVVFTVGVETSADFPPCLLYTSDAADD